MKNILTTLAYCLFSLLGLTATAQNAALFSVGADASSGFGIKAGTEVGMSGLTVAPSPDFTFTGTLNFTKNAQLVNASTLPHAALSFVFNDAGSTSATGVDAFNGTLRIRYSDEQVAGLIEGNLKLMYFDGTAWHIDNTSTCNVDGNFVQSSTLSNTSIREIAIASCSPTSFTEIITACVSQQWHGNTYTASNNTATWTGQNAAGCDSTVTLNLTINPLPTVSFSGLPSVVCSSPYYLVLTGFPSGGTFSGPGMSHNEFWSEDAFGPDGGVGAVTYSYTDANGCSNESSQTVTVGPMLALFPTVPNGPICGSGTAEFYASASNPNAGFIYSLDGGVTKDTVILDNEGHALIQVQGATTNQTLLVEALYDVASGCRIEVGASYTVVVNPLPTVSFSGLPSVVCSSPYYLVLTGFPSGGTFSGPGMSHNEFWSEDAFGPNGGVGAVTYSYTDANGCSNQSSQTVTVGPMLALFPTVPNGPICGSGTAEFYASASNPNAGFIYSLDGGVTKDTVILDNGGHALIQVQGATTNQTLLVEALYDVATGCRIEVGASYTVVVNPLPTPSISGTLAFCAGGSTTLDAGAGYSSYLWSTGATTQTITVNNTTPVSVTVTNAAGCSATSASVTPTASALSNAPTSITSSVAFALAGTNFTLSVNGGSLGTGASWKWYTASCGGTLIGTGASISVSQNVNTTYFVRAEGTCNTTACASITVNSQCGATSIISSAGTTAVCAGSAVTLTPVGALAPSAQWRWDDDCDAVPSTSDASATYTTASTFTVNPTCTTTYYLQSVGGVCGVTACIPITINVLAKPVTPGTISGSASVCPSTSVTYTIAAVAGATSYTWTAPTNGTFTSAQGGTSMTVSYASAFTSGTLKVKANNCSGSSSDKSLSITKQAAPSAPASITGSASVCPSTSVTYTIAAVTNATSYTWTAPVNATLASAQGGTSMTINYSSAFASGTLSVKATGCGGISAAKTLAVSKSAVPATPGTISGASPVCAGSTQTYSISVVTNASNYTWTLPAGMSFVSGTNTTGTSVQVVLSNTFASGTISVKANNCAGSSANKTKAITGTALPTQPSAITGAATLCNGSKLNVYSVTAATGFTFNWTVPTGAIITAGQGTNSIKVTWGTTSGTVNVTKSNSCGVSAPSTKAVTSVGCRTSEEELAEETSIETAVNTDLSVYPNPTAGNATVVFGSEVGGKYTINVLNALGQVVYSKTASSMIGENTHAIDISELSSGLYFINLMEESGMRSLRLVKR